MEQSLISALGGGATALIGKIVWDWLQQKRSKGDHCEDHECLQKEIVQLRMDWMAQSARDEKALAVIQNDLVYIKKKLDMNGAAK